MMIDNQGELPFTPGQVDQMVRQAIQLCWMTIPADKRTLAATKAEITRLVERAFRDYEDDARQFGQTP